MANSRERRKFRRLLAAVLRESKKFLMPPKEQLVEARMIKLSGLDLGLICGVLALLFTIAAIFEPVRSWYFIVLSLLFAAILTFVTILKSLELYPYGPHPKWISAIVVIGVMCLFSAYGWRVWPVTSYEPSRLRLMSVEELKNAEKKLSNRMRDFEATYDKNSLKLMMGAKQASNQDKIMQAGQDYRNEFNKLYLVDGISMRAELLFRLGPHVPTDQEILSAEPMGALGYPLPLSRALEAKIVGPHSVSDAATYLDGLARLLR